MASLPGSVRNSAALTPLFIVFLIVLPIASVIARENKTLFYTNGESIARLETLGINSTLHLLKLESPHQPVALAFDTAGQRLYWSDLSAKMIYSLNRTLDDGRKLFQMNTVATVYALAIDSRSRLLFYADDANNVIAMVTLNGGYFRTVLSNTVSDPHGLDLDTTNGIVYYADAGERPKIASIRYDGTDPTTLVSVDIKTPFTLTFDASDGKLYWCDLQLQRVESLDVRGSAQRRVLLQGAAATFTNMVIYQDYLYFSTSNKSDIQWMRKDGNRTTSYHNDNGKGVRGLCITSNDTTRGPVVAEGCKCSHICIPGQSGQWNCLCPDGLYLQSDGLTCSVDLKLDRFLVLTDSRRHQLFRMDLMTGVHFPLHVPAIQPYAVDVDVLQQRVFWSDISERTLRSAALHGGNVALVRRLPGDAIPTGLRVDAKAGLLFYTDNGLNVLAVMRLDGSDYKELANRNLDQPKALALDMEARYVYFTDHGAKPKIERMTYEGMDRISLVTTNILVPTGLTLDKTGQRLYWCDYSSQKIESITVEGSDRRTVLLKIPSKFFAMVFYNDFLYVIEVSNTGVERVRSNGTGLAIFGATDFKDPRDVVVYDSGILTTSTSAKPSSPSSPAPSPAPTPTPASNASNADNGIIIGSSFAGLTLVVVIILAVVIICLFKRKQKAKTLRSPSVCYDPHADYARLSESGGSGGSNSQLGMGIWSVQGPNGAVESDRQVNNLYLSAGKLKLEPPPDYEAAARRVVEEPDKHEYETLPCDRDPTPRPSFDSDTYIRPVFKQP